MLNVGQQRASPCIVARVRMPINVFVFDVIPRAYLIVVVISKRSDIFVLWASSFKYKVNSFVDASLLCILISIGTVLGLIVFINVNAININFLFIAIWFYLKFNFIIFG